MQGHWKPAQSITRSEYMRFEKVWYNPTSGRGARVLQRCPRFSKLGIFVGFSKEFPKLQCNFENSLLNFVCQKISTENFPSLEKIFSGFFFL